MQSLLLLLTFTYLLDLLTCSTAKDHETSIEDSSAGFVILFQFGVVCVLRFGPKNVRLLYTCMPPRCRKVGVKQNLFARTAREFTPPSFKHQALPDVCWCEVLDWNNCSSF